MKKSFICLVLLFFVIFTAISSTNLVFGDTVMSYTECESNASAMCTIESSSGRVLYGKNIHKKLPMASTTKIFTALTVLENCKDLSEIVDIDDRAVGIEGTSIYLRKGEKLSVKELLLGMLLPSGNDSASALAYYIGGDIPSFCKMMENTAKNAGATNSSFKNPHGLDQDGHYTTAYDLALISAKALENKDFYEISTTKTAVISGNSEVKSRYLKNKNKLLGTFEGCNGVKTGFTDNAGRCFVASATRDNMTVVSVVLNCGPMFEECGKFLEKTFNEYKLVEVVSSYDVVKSLEVEKGRESSVKLFTRKAFCYPLTKDEELKINTIYDLPEKLTAPVKKEQIVGSVKVYLGEKLLFEDEIYTRDFVKKDTLWSYVGDVLKFWD